MSDPSIKVALLGAGYIASWHADAIKRVKGASISAVCDLSHDAASALADSLGATAYTDLDEMLENDPCSVVHVLTTPSAHVDPAKKIIEAGRHCYMEKPFCLSSEDAQTLDALAQSKNVKLGANHNFTMLPGYEALRRDIKAGKLGMIDSIQMNWRFPLMPLRSGPYGLWMLREPQNPLYEIGSHLFAFLADMFDEMDNINVRLRHPTTIPGNVTHFQGWTITGEAGSSAVNIDISLIEGHDDRSVTVRGTGALAYYNYAEDVYRLERAPMLDIVTGPLALQLGQAAQIAKCGVVNASRQFVSLNKLAPFGLSMARAMKSFYGSIANNTPVDRRLSAGLATTALRHIEDVMDIAEPILEKAQPPKIEIANVENDNPTVLVIGGTGFIGRHTCHALADAGHHVRVFSRGRVSGFDRPDGRITGFTGSLKSREDILAALEGIDTVYNFARAVENTWEGYLENDVGVAKLIGECCIEAGTRRLIYTGTISSYDASQADRTITEDTPFDENLEERDLYSRCKAKCEEELLKLHREKELPLVIARPGIVIGEGGPLQHWGIAMWRGSTSCKMWGKGKNILPFVLVSDTADGLVAMMGADNIEGESFNLIGEPMLSARDYFDEISKAYGVKMRAKPTPTARFFVVDLVKYFLKVTLARKKNITKPTLRDWQSRMQLSPYDNTKSKQKLDWQPEADRASFIEEGISGIALFGVEANKMSRPFEE